MSIKEKAKAKIIDKTKKVAFKVLKPFLPFIIIIVGLFFAICSLIDAIFIQEVQADNTSMSEVQVELKNRCIAKAEYLNTCHNYIENEMTNYLLDMDNRETEKEIEWSHLYALMAFHNMIDNTDINEDLLNQVATYFESTFRYEKVTLKAETKTTDENGNENTSTREETIYILVESDTIIRPL